MDGISCFFSSTGVPGPACVWNYLTMSLLGKKTLHHMKTYIHMCALCLGGGGGALAVRVSADSVLKTPDIFFF